MKVIVSSFQFESCSFSGTFPDVNDFEYFEGQDIFKKLVVYEPLKSAGFEVIPSIYANALPGGLMPLDLYNGYKEKILQTVKENPDADGIFLYLHGSMEVEQTGSGERQLLREIREITGVRPLISLVLDLHANMTEELVDFADIICGYKTAPHVDQAETQMRAVNLLIDCLKNNIRPVSKIVGIPMLAMGDAMLTAEEPLKTLIQKTREYEKQPEILSANLFFGHMWIDAANTRASVVVTALKAEQAETLAKDMAKMFWDTRAMYRLAVENGVIGDCINSALQTADRRVFISDSGDNTTAGADGRSLTVLNAFINHLPFGKKVCITGITDEALLDKVKAEKLTTFLYPVDGKEIMFTVKNTGKILGWAKEIIGDCLTASYQNIDVIFTDKRAAFISEENFTEAGVSIDDYDIIVVKLGYLFSELHPFCDKHYFALTDGSSCVDIRRFDYKKLVRPLYPLDEEMVKTF